MELARNLHLRLQEMCDCYLETDFLPEMRRMSGAQVADPEEEGLKYLSLALMHAISEKAAKLTLKRKQGAIQVTIKDEEKKVLPPPPAELFDKAVEIMRRILHLDENKGKSSLVLGLRNGQLEMEVKIKHEDDKDTLQFKFAPW